MIVNDAYRVWSHRDEEMRKETMEQLQEFIREYLLHTQEELCKRIKQDFSITVFAAGVKDGGQNAFERTFMRQGDGCTELCHEIDHSRVA